MYQKLKTYSDQKNHPEASRIPRSIFYQIYHRIMTELDLSLMQAKSKDEIFDIVNNKTDLPEDVKERCLISIFYSSIRLETKDFMQIATEILELSDVSILNFSAISANFEIFNAVLERRNSGSNLTIEDLPFHYACIADRLDFAKELINRLPNDSDKIDLICDGGVPQPFWDACDYGLLQMAQWLYSFFPNKERGKILRDGGNEEFEYFEVTCFMAKFYNDWATVEWLKSLPDFSQEDHKKLQARIGLFRKDIQTSIDLHSVDKSTTIIRIIP